MKHARNIGYVDPSYVHAREGQISSLMDIARWPDGTPRNGRAEPISREMFAPKQRCEVLEAFGVGEGA